MRRALAAAAVAALGGCASDAARVSAAAAPALALLVASADAPPVPVAIATTGLDVWRQCRSDATVLVARAGQTEVMARCRDRDRQLFEARRGDDGRVEVALRRRLDRGVIARVAGEVTLRAHEPATPPTAPPATAPIPVVIDTRPGPLLRPEMIDALPRAHHPRLGAPLAALLHALAVADAERVDVEAGDGTITVLDATTFVPGPARWAAITRNRRGEVRIVLARGGALQTKLRDIRRLAVYTRHGGGR